jgi:hypothetical protein
VETAYVFLERPDPAVRESFGEAELESARGRIEAVLERLASGRFDVTHNPHRALCLDCPARERLCSHATADQMREEPEPPVEPRGSRAADEGERRMPDDGEPQLSLLEGG